jgi:hypothetical protein
MAHCCISIVGSNDSMGPVAVRDSGSLLPDNRNYELTALTYPLAKIAERLGVQGIPDGERLPPGYWVCDGGHGSKAYNWFELVDKMIACFDLDHAIS